MSALDSGISILCRDALGTLNRCRSVVDAAAQTDDPERARCIGIASARGAARAPRFRRIPGPRPPGRRAGRRVPSTHRTTACVDRSASGRGTPARSSSSPARRRDEIQTLAIAQQRSSGRSGSGNRVISSGAFARAIAWATARWPARRGVAASDSRPSATRHRFPGGCRAAPSQGRRSALPSRAEPDPRFARSRSPGSRRAPRRRVGHGASAPSIRSVRS